MGRKRREVSVETERVLVVSGRAGNRLLWCGRCRAEVLMLTVDEAALITRSTSLAIFRLAEAGGLHFVETPEGGLLICSNSLV
ncbi:MAG: hypothetical protein M3362_24565 [Acidobacteriota bacterium]|nr:hypothetical protein [Acidobacteriota bacterium]